MIGDALTRRAQELARGALAVRGRDGRASASARRACEPGNAGLVQADGTIEGFIGGVCAQHSVRLHALEAIESGTPLLLRIVPDGPRRPFREEGAVTVRNTCLSGGAIEIFLEPVLPAPRVLVAGDSPIVAALRTLGPEVGLEIVAAHDIQDGVLAPTAGDLALVVAAHGQRRGRDPARGPRGGRPLRGPRGQPEARRGGDRGAARRGRRRGAARPAGDARRDSTSAHARPPRSRSRSSPASSRCRTRRRLGRGPDLRHDGGADTPSSTTRYVCSRATTFEERREPARSDG